MRRGVAQRGVAWYGGSRRVADGGCPAGGRGVTGTVAFHPCAPELTDKAGEVNNILSPVVDVTNVVEFLMEEPRDEKLAHRLHHEG